MSPAVLCESHLAVIFNSNDEGLMKFTLDDLLRSICRAGIFLICTRHWGSSFMHSQVPRPGFISFSGWLVDMDPSFSFDEIGQGDAT
jgi:hypothetical protein